MAMITDIMDTKKITNTNADLHIHILPKMDDGSSSSDESIAMLEILKEQNVKNIVATPHFYLNENGVEKFLDRRQASYERLLSKYQFEGNICLGAEVYYAENMYRIENFEKLKMGKSNFILIELPYLKKIDIDILEDIKRMINETGLNIILAHIERFWDKFTWRAMREMSSMDVIYQINLSSLTNDNLKKTVFKILKKDKFIVLGSDGHNTDKRSPSCYNQGLEVIKNKFGNDYVEKLLQNNDKIFSKII